MVLPAHTRLLEPPVDVTRFLSIPSTLQYSAKKINCFPIAFPEDTGSTRGKRKSEANRFYTGNVLGTLSTDPPPRFPEPCQFRYWVRTGTSDKTRSGCVLDVLNYQYRRTLKSLKYWITSTNHEPIGPIQPSGTTSKTTKKNTFLLDHQYHPLKPPMLI